MCINWKDMCLQHKTFLLAAREYSFHADNVICEQYSVWISEYRWQEPYMACIFGVSS
jgi:hypothetical protein